MIKKEQENKAENNTIVIDYKWNEIPTDISNTFSLWRNEAGDLTYWSIAACIFIGGNPCDRVTGEDLELVNDTVYVRNWI